MTSTIATTIRGRIAGKGATLLALAALLTSAGSLSAQPRYVLEVGQEPYVPLTNAEPLAMPWGPLAQNPNAGYTPGSETYRVMGEDYVFSPTVGMGISKFGNLQLVGSSWFLFVDPFYTRLDSIAADAEVRVRIDGASGDQIMKVEWHNVGFPGCSAEFGTSFQIWVHQRSGVIEMRYGETRDGCDSAYNGGLDDGPYVGFLKATQDFSSLIEVFFLAGDPADPSTITNATPFMDGPPAPNTVYRFIPTGTSGVDEKIADRNAARIAPNPAEDRATFEFVTSGTEDVTVDLYDAGGRRVRSILNERREAGEHAVEVDLRGLPSGAYLVMGTIGDRGVMVSVVVP